MTTLHSMRIPGDFNDIWWVVDGRVIDPLNRDRYDCTELEVVGVCLHVWGSTLEVPLRTIPDNVLDFFSAELNGDYECEQEGTYAEGYS